MRTPLVRRVTAPKPAAKTVIYFLAFLFSLHLTPALYVNANFLGEFIQPNYIGYVFSTASLFTIFGFLAIRPLLKKFGNYKTFLGSLTITLISLIFLTLDTTPTWGLIAAFILASSMQAICYFHLDVFLEHYSQDSETGTIRGIFLTAQNLAYVIGPLIAGLLLTDHDFWKVYLFGVLLLIPVIFFTVRHMRSFKDPAYHKPELLKTGKKIFKRKNLFHAFSASALLFGFYSWMIIYIPIYLHTVIGFDVREVTTIMGIALFAFVLLQPPLGYIADKWLGEKEILIAGFIIIAGSTSAISFLEVPHFWAWAALLFVTRVGASMVEIMSETYFFKNIAGEDMNIMSFFRIVGPTMYTIFPALASLLLLVIDLKFIFLVLGCFMLYGVKVGLAMKDTL